jgi:multidrug efflux pump subunit AcrA (membrane-fusion protein)
VAAGSESAAGTSPPATPDLDRLRIDRASPAARRRRRRGPWLVVVVLLLVVAGGVYATMGKELFAPRVATARVQRVPATEGAIRTTASGYVVARRRAAISSKLSGRLEELTVDVGDDVPAGKLLGRLGHADLDAAVEQARALTRVRRAEVESAKRDAAASAAAAEVAKTRISEPEATLHEMESRLADAERTLAREKTLKPGVATTQESLDRATMERDVASRRIEQAKAQIETLRSQANEAGLEAAAAAGRVETAESSVATADAALKQAEAVRADADIYAPFSGRVLRKEAEIGEMVAPVNSTGSTTRGAIVSLADFSSLEMEVDVIERDVGQIETGAVCRILLDSRRDHPYAGVVRQIVPTADRTKSTVQVKVSFRALDAHVLPEMSGRVEFLKGGVDDAVVLGHDRLFAPKAAIVVVGGKRGAFEMKNGKAAFREITSPASPVEKDGLVEIATGFVGGEDVIVSPPARLADGDVVRAEETPK